MPKTTYVMPYGWPLYYVIQQGPNGISLARKGGKLDLWVANQKQGDRQGESFHFSDLGKRRNAYAKVEDKFWFLTGIPPSFSDQETESLLDYLIEQEDFIISTYESYYVYADHFDLHRWKMLHNVFLSGADVRSTEFLIMLKNCRFVKNYSPDEPSLLRTFQDWYTTNKYCCSKFWNPVKMTLEAEPCKRLDQLATLLSGALYAEEQHALGIGYRAGSLGKDQFWRLLEGQNLASTLTSDTKSWITSNIGQWSSKGNSHQAHAKPQIEEEIRMVQSTLNERKTERWPTFVPGYGCFIG